MSIRFINSYFFIMPPKVEIHLHYSQQNFLDFIKTNFGLSGRGNKEHIRNSLFCVCHISHAECINRTPPRNIPKIKIIWCTVLSSTICHGNSIKMLPSRWYCVKNQCVFSAVYRLLRLCLLIQFSILDADRQRTTMLGTNANKYFLPYKASLIRVL